MMCGEPREVNVGEKITLMGWVQRNRKLGGLQFIDLRDRTGIVQIVLYLLTGFLEGFSKNAISMSFNRFLTVILPIILI